MQSSDIAARIRLAKRRSSCCRTFSTRRVRVGLSQNQSMPEPITRDGILDALRDMPPDATIDDAIERLVFLARVEAGLNELDAGEGVPHEEAKRRLQL